MADHLLQIITSPLGMEDFATSPVNKANKVQWTAEQREWASDADCITTLSDIQPKSRHQNPLIKRRLEEFQDCLKVEMPNHMDHIESSSELDKPFATIHFDYYIRFAEKGYGAPTTTHPDLIKKASVTRYSVITTIFQDVGSIIAQAIEKYLLDTYSHLNMATLSCL
ncbi:hypothetical protein C8R48DRAFT_774117 [Suillus tomentosus]|nr:hypothetical protein C8R48DRAFT_774117 [Suillus tomentosus]